MSSDATAHLLHACAVLIWIFQSSASRRTSHSNINKPLILFSALQISISACSITIFRIESVYSMISVCGCLEIVAASTPRIRDANTASLFPGFTVCSWPASFRTSDATSGRKHVFDRPNLCYVYVFLPVQAKSRNALPQFRVSLSLISIFSPLLDGNSMRNSESN